MARGGLRAAALRTQPGDRRAITLLAPLGDVRGIDALAAQEGTPFGGPGRIGVIFLEDAQLLDGAAGLALRRRLNLRGRPGRLLRPAIGLMGQLLTHVGSSPALAH